MKSRIFTVEWIYAIALLTLFTIQCGASETVSQAIAVDHNPATPGQTITLRWYFTGTKVLVSGGRFGAGMIVTGQQKLTDQPRRATRYTFDVWYVGKGRPTASGRTLQPLHARYSLLVNVRTEGAAPSTPVTVPNELTEQQFAADLVALTNKERAAQGLPPLKLQPELSHAAAWMAGDIARYEYLDHTDHQGRTLEARIPNFGYNEFSNLGENLAAGQPSAKLVFQEWMKSPGHRANILNPDFAEIGIGRACVPASRYKTYWAVDFGARFDIFPVLINDGALQTTRSEVKLYIHGKDRAKKMRISNNGTQWTDWQSYEAVKNWTLRTTKGMHTVYVELSDGQQTFQSTETIELLEATANAR